MQSSRKAKNIQLIRFVIGILLCSAIILFVYMLLPDSRSETGNAGHSMLLSSSTISEAEELSSTVRLPLSDCEVCIDAGHGGQDIGSSKGKRLEKDDTLDLSMKIFKYLSDKGISVAISRTNDTYLSLQERKDFAEDSNCTLFISIHRNLYEGNSKINGAEAWIHSSDPVNAHSLASSILNDICSSNNFDNPTFDNRGVKCGTSSDAYDNYAINKVSMTSMILEMGFITSPYDNSAFDNNLDTYAKIIGDDIIDYLNNK